MSRLTDATYTSCLLVAAIALSALVIKTRVAPLFIADSSGLVPPQADTAPRVMRLGADLIVGISDSLRLTLIIPSDCRACAEGILAPLFSVEASLSPATVSIVVVPGIDTTDDTQAMLLSHYVFCAAIEGRQSSAARILWSDLSAEEFAAAIGFANTPDFSACVHEQRYLGRVEADWMALGRRTHAAPSLLTNDIERAAAALPFALHSFLKPELTLATEESVR